MIRILQQDNRVTKGIFIVIIGAAILTMVITLVPGIFDSNTANSSTVFATVRTPGFFGKLTGDSSDISMQEVQQMTLQQLQQQHLPEFYAALLTARVGQQLVAHTIQEREADRLGLAVSDQDLANFLKNGSFGQYLFPGGQFVGKDKYTSFVEQYFNLSVADFEKRVKADLEVQRLQALVTGGITVSDTAVRNDFLKQGTKVKFDYAAISAADIKKTINPTDADLQAFFQQNTARYAHALPETRKLQFFSFDASAMPGGKPQVSDADIQAYYNAHLNQYSTPEQVKTRHILIMAAKDADAKTDAAARARAQDVLNKLKAGGNFADLAKQYSEDTGSKAQGGELPLMPTSNLDPAYGKAAMALSPGQTSDLVRSQFGYHIIQTEQKTPAGAKPLAEVKDQISAQLEQQKAGAAEQQFANNLAAEAKKNGMDKTAAAHNLHLVTTDYIARDATIPQLADSQSLLTQAFGMAKGASPAVASTGEGFAVFQVVDVKEAHAPAFADWKSHVLDDYREQKAPELLNAQVKKLADRARVLNDLRKAAAELNVPVKSSDLVGRDAQVPDLGAMSGDASVAFTLPRGGISGPVNEGPNAAVLQVTDKQEPSAEDIAKNFAETKDKLLNQQREEVYEVYVRSLMDSYEKAGAIVYSNKGQQSPLGAQ